MFGIFNSMKRRMSSREGHHDAATDSPTTSQAPPNAADEDPQSQKADLAPPPTRPKSNRLYRAARQTSNETSAKPPGLLIAEEDPQTFQRLPCLKDCPPSEYQETLIKKINACSSVIFDFSGAAADMNLEEKEAKKATLGEIMDFINEPRRGCTPEQVIEELIRMVAVNVFRSLPPTSSSPSALTLTDPEESEPAFESAWPHLQAVYEILLRLVVSDINPKIVKKYIDHTFVLKLLDLFASEDPRERDYVKTVMHRVYGKIMPLRSFIRKAIQNVFFRYIHEDDGQPGVSELLEILGSIINGFAQPLKDEHKMFLKKCMIPLHKTRHFISFHTQLTYCMTQYIEKDSKLVEPIINGLLRYWPVTNTSKEVLFLNELEEILELSPSTEFQKVMEPLFRRMALCIRSPHFQVSERVLFLWNNTRIVKLVNQNKNTLFPIVIGALYKNTKDHWNATVHGLTFNVCKLLAEADPHLFDHCNDESLKREEAREKDREEKRLLWQALRSQVGD